MTLMEATELMEAAVHTRGGTWADFGAGTGLFTRALAGILGPAGRVYGVDRDPRALSALRQSAPEDAGAMASILPVEGDFQRLDLLLGRIGSRLDGALFANALHFTPEAGRILLETAEILGEDGRIVVIEYDRRVASRWVPFPVCVDRLRTLAANAALAPPRVVCERPSAYGGMMYCAVLERTAAGEPRA